MFKKQDFLNIPFLLYCRINATDCNKERRGGVDVTEKEKEELLTMIASSSMKNHNLKNYVALLTVFNFLIVICLILLLLKG